MWRTDRNWTHTNVPKMLKIVVAWLLFLSRTSVKSLLICCFGHIHRTFELPFIHHINAKRPKKLVYERPNYDYVPVKLIQKHVKLWLMTVTSCPTQHFSFKVDRSISKSVNLLNNDENIMHRNKIYYVSWIRWEKNTIIVPTVRVHYVLNLRKIHWWLRFSPWKPFYRSYL